MEHGQRLNIEQVEQICRRLRKYGISPADAAAFAKVLVSAADTVVPLHVVDLVSLMGPKRPPAIPLAQKVEVQARRQALREALRVAWPDDSKAVTEYINCHEDDYRSLCSAVQYRARRSGMPWSVTRQGRKQCLVQVGF